MKKYLTLISILILLSQVSMHSMSSEHLAVAKFCQSVNCFNGVFNDYTRDSISTIDPKQLIELLRQSLGDNPEDHSYAYKDIQLLIYKNLPLQTRASKIKIDNNQQKLVFCILLNAAQKMACNHRSITRPETEYEQQIYKQYSNAIKIWHVTQGKRYSWLSRCPFLLKGYLLWKGYPLLGSGKLSHFLDSLFT